VYFFGGQFDKSVRYSKLVTDPFATDYAYHAAASAMTGDIAAAKVTAAEVGRLDPNWSVEDYLSRRRLSGQHSEEAARKAGVAACVSADRLSSLPNLIRLKTCDEERAHQAAG
jgi:hypothetical protein